MRVLLSGGVCLGDTAMVTTGFNDDVKLSTGSELSLRKLHKNIGDMMDKRGNHEPKRPEHKYM